MEGLSPANRRRLEMLTTASMWPAMAFTAAGAVGVALIPYFEVYSSWLPAAHGGLALGLLLAIVAVAASYPLDVMRSVGARFRGGTSYDRQKHWGNLKAASLLLNGLAVGGAVVFLGALLVRTGVVQARIDVGIVDRGALILVLAIASAHMLALHYSLRFETPRDMSGTRLILSLLGQLVALLSVMIAGLALVRGRGGTETTLGLDAGGVPMVVLGGHVFAAYALFVSRKLPTFSILYTEERDAYSQSGIRSGQGKVMAPALLAFALLMLVFLLFVLFGVGAADLRTLVTASPLVMGTLGFVVLAILLSLVASFSIAANQEDKVELWRAPRNPQEKKQQAVLLTSIGLAAALFLLALLTWQGMMGMQGRAWVHFFCLGLLAGTGPYGFYMAIQHKRMQQLEERFPDFLRDIASSHKGGLTLGESVRVASRGEYGPLTPEIRKMADQLSWNVSFSEALIRFGDRVQTPLVERAVSLIQEADRSGGSTTDVLLAAARDAREIKNMENERRLSMGLYTVVIYITFFVFLAVAAVLYGQFVPELVRSSEAAQELGGSNVKGVGGATLRLDQFQQFYFLAAVMQGLGDGVVAGMMGSGRAVLGLRHAFIMVLISYLTFSLFLV